MHNAPATRPVHFAGLDVPAAGGSLAPVLEPVARYLAGIDPRAARYARTALELSERLAEGSGPTAARARLGVDAAVQDRRVTAMRETYIDAGGAALYEDVVEDAWAAWRTDQMQRAMAALFDGKPDTADLSARDRYLADSLVSWQGPGSGPVARSARAGRASSAYRCACPR
ncbi:erythromycin esterase family protein [Streptomyces sp. NPDC004050]